MWLLTLDLAWDALYWRLATALARHPRCTWRHSERSRLNFLLHSRDSLKKKEAKGSMADATASGARRYASVADVRADLECAGGDASVLCGFGRCFCVKTALSVSGRKERGHWPPRPDFPRPEAAHPGATNPTLYTYIAGKPW